MLRRSNVLGVSVISASLLCAGGLKPREKVTDYPVHAELQHGFTIGADYLVHTVPSPTSSTADGMVANDYLVIEIGVFGPKASAINIGAGTFEVKINGKLTIAPDSPEAVAGSLEFWDRAERSRIEASGGIGNIGVSTAPNPGPRFPGDPNTGRPMPLPVPVQNPALVGKEGPLSIKDRVQRASLPQGDLSPPAAGLIFFLFTGKTKSIKTLELIYEGPEGKVTLRLE